MVTGGYTKLFPEILTSTIWQESDHTRLVWITMLALCDKRGMVTASVPGIASHARVPLESAIKAIEVLSSPDKWSRTKDHEGRRIREINGGWEILNFIKYRTLHDAEYRRAYNARKQAEYRARQQPQKLAGEQTHENLIRNDASEDDLNRHSDSMSDYAEDKTYEVGVVNEHGVRMTHD